MDVPEALAEAAAVVREATRPVRHHRVRTLVDGLGRAYVGSAGMTRAVVSLAATGAALVAATTAVAAPPPCQVAQLSVALRNPTGGVGHLGTHVVLTNRSHRACLIEGYASYR